MGTVAVLVMSPGSFEQTSIPSSHRSSTEKWLQLAKYAVLEEKVLENVDDDI